MAVVVTIVCGTALLAFGLWIGHLRKWIVIVTVDGASMEPTLAGGDRMVARRVSAPALRVGQIVIVEHPIWQTDHWEWPPPGEGPISSRRWLVKRVAALPGDPVPEQVLPAVDGGAGSLVPSDVLVILGDNVHASLDSRELGYVPANLVLGAALRRYGQRSHPDHLSPVTLVPAQATAAPRPSPRPRSASGLRTPDSEEQFGPPRAGGAEPAVNRPECSGK